MYFIYVAPSVCLATFGLVLPERLLLKSLINITIGFYQLKSELGSTF